MINYSITIANQKESFTYRNTMTNGSISEQLKLQELDSQSCERKIAISQDSNQENLFSVNLENKGASNQKIAKSITHLISLA